MRIHKRPGSPRLFLICILSEECNWQQKSILNNHENRRKIHLDRFQDWLPARIKQAFNSPGAKKILNNVVIIDDKRALKREVKMTLIQINDCNNRWVPKEISTAAVGTTVAATSNLAIQFLTSLARNQGLTVVKDFAMYGCGAASIAGAVVTVYSMVRLCQKAAFHKNELHKNITVTALGALGTALAKAIGNIFWEIAPSFQYLNGHSMAFCIGTNFAWHACAILGLGSIVFTAYAAYLTGQAILAATQYAARQ